MKREIIFAASALLILLSLAVGVSCAEEISPKTAQTLSPTTGLATDKPYRPFLVTVSNAAEARPAWNLSEADIVYEAIILGPGHTRYLALYNDNHPKRVGPVRSARAYHAYLRQEWDCPLVHAGGMGDTKDVDEVVLAHGVPKNFQFNNIRTGPYSYGLGRDPSRNSPHNLVANLSWMLENVWPADLDNKAEPYEPVPPLFVFSQTPSKGDQPAIEIEIHFEGTEKENPNYFPRYVYNAEAHAYERWYCGYKQYDAESGKRIIANNIIVQQCALTYTDNQARQPVIALTGEGKMDAYIDGMRIEGTWLRETMNDQTQFFDADGNELVLRPGKTFIQIIPTAYGFDFSKDTGLCRYAPDL